MSNLTTIRGAVSHAHTVARVTGQSGYGGTIKTRHKLQFRIDGRPATMRGTPQITDGDTVTAIGTEGNAGFGAYCIRNHSTGLDYKAPAMIMNGVVGILGVATYMMVSSCATMGGSSFNVGGFFMGLVTASPVIALGFYFLLIARRCKRANAMLATLPAP